MNRHTPTRILDPAGKVAEVFRAIRDAGGRGATLDEVAAATGYGARQIAPLVGHLHLIGYVQPVGRRGPTAPGHWPRYIYATTRTAAHLGPVARERTAR